jgi:CTP synthase (UTP-ammonia lyase)
MTASLRVGLIGDRDDSTVAHRAIPRALALAADSLEATVTTEWLPTSELRCDRHLYEFDGLWCVPASPYRSTEGALCAIRFAREEGIPFLGTCGGFQHAVLEYARTVLGWSDATHAELDSGIAARQVIAPLACALVETTGQVTFAPGTRLHAAYGTWSATEGYHCRYGVNPVLLQELERGSLVVSARDDAGEARAIELSDHPFFVATLFQPERAAMEGRVPPLVLSFLRAVKVPQPWPDSAPARA